MGDLRIKNTEILQFKRGKEVTVNFEGKVIKAYDSESVAAALYANNIYVFSRSSKFHRPRGYYCGVGNCSSCMMEIDGIPNQRACTIKVHDEMVVKRDSHFVNTDHDIFRVIDYFSFLFPVGFYYKHFNHPAVLRNFYLNTIAKMGGMGKLPNSLPAHIFTTTQTLKTDILIIGGGVSGLIAGIEAAKAGVNVIIIEKDWYLGGKYANNPESCQWHGSITKKYKIINTLISTIKTLKNVNILTNVVAFGLYDTHVAASSHTTLYKIMAKSYIIATGTNDATLIFDNNDLPNIMLITAAKRLIYNYGIVPGFKGVILNSTDMPFLETLQRLGIKLTLVFTDHVNAKLLQKFSNIDIYEHCSSLYATGTKKVTKLKFLKNNKKIAIDTEFVIIDGIQQPAYELVLQRGGTLKQLEDRFVLLKTEYMEVFPNFYIIGSLADAKTIEEIEATAKIAVLHILASLAVTKPDELNVWIQKYLQYADKRTIVKTVKSRRMVQ